MKALSQAASEYIAKGNVVVTVSTGVHFPEGVEIPNFVAAELHEYFIMIRIPAQEAAAAVVSSLLHTDEVAIVDGFKHMA